LIVIKRCNFSFYTQCLHFNVAAKYFPLASVLGEKKNFVDSSYFRLICTPLKANLPIICVSLFLIWPRE